MSKNKTTVWQWLKKLSNYAFIGVILLITLVGLVKTLCFPDDMSEYENRYAEKVESLTIGAYLNGSFQESMDDALGDQVTLSTTFKKLYNKLNTMLQSLTSNAIIENIEYFENHYFWLDGIRMFGRDTLVYGTYPEYELEKLDAKIENYNHIFAGFPETEFYLYYIEKDTDINFETNAKVPFYDKLRDNLNLPTENMACFRINNFEEFSQLFYKTDHHWNYVGSYKGYGEIMDLLGCEDDLLEPVEFVTTPGRFSGSKAATSGAMFSEPFSAYRFAFPEMEITISGNAASDYGDQPGYLSGLWGAPTYGKFYGGDDSEIIFDTARPERDNLLIIGESYDNAVLKLIASHYNRTHSIDLRYYEAVMGEEFAFADYLEEHDIDKVLLIGNVDYYLMSEFMLEE